MGLGPIEIGIIAFAVVLLFGASKIAGLGGALGRSIRDFRRELTEDGSARTKKDLA